MIQADANDMFGGDWEQIDLGPSAGAGRPGQVIRLQIAPLPDHPPAAFTWRKHRHRVRRADGPERIVGEWWKREGEVRAVRDYFAVEDEDGRRFWLFRRGDGQDATSGDLQWFLHGLF